VIVVLLAAVILVALLAWKPTRELIYDLTLGWFIGNHL
jgi:hypothetical protein